MAGATKIYTFDLNKRLQKKLLKEAIKKIIENKSIIKQQFLDYIDDLLFEDRISILINLQNNIDAFLKNTNIIYVAPGDASNSMIPNEEIDVHFSCTVLEHIPKNNIIQIMLEAKRILKKDGFSIHFIDPSDHFEHQDKGISKINFLKFNFDEWNYIAGNQFAYCNRLRYTEYQKLFEGLGFNIVFEEKSIDALSKKIMLQSFKVDQLFEKYTIDELCTVRYDVLLNK